MNAFKEYHVIDLQGRLWDRTNTAVKAVRIAQKLENEKGLKCQIKEMKGTSL